MTRRAALNAHRAAVEHSGLLTTNSDKPHVGRGRGGLLSARARHVQGVVAVRDRLGYPPS
jgi:hypothetical protein